MKKISDVYRLLKELMHPLWDEDERNTVYTLTDEYFKNMERLYQEFTLLVGKENARHIIFESSPKNYKKIVNKYLHNK